MLSSGGYLWELFQDCGDVISRLLGDVSGLEEVVSGLGEVVSGLSEVVPGSVRLSRD